MKLKKLASLVLALVMCMALAVPTLAYEHLPDGAKMPVENTVVTLTDSITSDIVKSFETAILAYTTEEDGTNTPVSCTVTISEILNTSRSNGAVQGGKTYEATVTASVVKDETNFVSYKTASNWVFAHLTMRWTDVLGPNNTLDRLSGNVDVFRGKYATGKVSWGIRILPRICQV